jgi:hypothetical protein
MKLCGLTICVNYADFLVWSLPSAKHLFDRLIVVTSTADFQTKKVCDHNYVECVQTDIMFGQDKSFNKGAAINLGLDLLDFPEWCIHFDSDIVFPTRTKEFLLSKNWNKDVLYGTDRLMIKNWSNWINFYTNPFPQYVPGSIWPGFEVGYRVIMNGGYVPVGFFQMAHKKSKYLGAPIYPTEFTSAAESDLEFALRYPPENRQLIPDFFVYHLESEQKNLGINWNGRKTKRFGPD